MANSISTISHDNVSPSMTNEFIRKPRKSALLIGSNYIYTVSRRQEAEKSSYEGAVQNDSSLNSPCKDVDRWKKLLLSEWSPF